MNMILEALSSYLRNVSPIFEGKPTQIKMGMLDIEKNGFALRLIPSTPGLRFMNRTQIERAQIQLLGKSQNQEAVTDIMGRFSDALELANDELLIPGYSFISSDVSSTLAFVEKTSANEYIYSLFFHVELIKRG